jgi:5-methylcytosine-specific restriction enzyme A
VARLIAMPGNRYTFVVGNFYTRKEVLNILGVPEDQQGGSWYTGYRSYLGDYFLFVNIGLPGRTGHDYPNALEGDRLTWYGRTGASLSHPSIQALLDGRRNVYIFYRTETRGAFTFGGLGEPTKFEDVVPVKIVWRLLHARNLPPEILPQEVDRSKGFYEGTLSTVVVNVYERSSAAREACIRFWGCKCIVCELDFGEVYGELGAGFIHVHHLKPLSEIAATYELNPIEDLRPVCPNCHAMLHRTRPPLEIEELQSRIRARA